MNWSLNNVSCSDIFVRGGHWRPVGGHTLFVLSNLKRISKQNAPFWSNCTIHPYILLDNQLIICQRHDLLMFVEHHVKKLDIYILLAMSYLAKTIDVQLPVQYVGYYSLDIALKWPPWWQWKWVMHVLPHCWGLRGCDCMIVGFMHTYAISDF